MEFVSITLVTKSVNQSKHFYQNISFHQANLLLSEKRFLLDIPNSVNCIFSLTGQKICPLASIPREALFFNIDSMTYRIGHTANDKTLSFSVNILKLHSKKWSIREISLFLKDIFAELHRPHENLRKNE